MLWVALISICLVFLVLVLLVWVMKRLRLCLHAPPGRCDCRFQ